MLRMITKKELQKLGITDPVHQTIVIRAAAFFLENGESSHGIESVAYQIAAHPVVFRKLYRRLRGEVFAPNGTPYKGGIWYVWGDNSRRIQSSRTYEEHKIRFGKRGS